MSVITFWHLHYSYAKFGFCIVMQFQTLKSLCRCCYAKFVCCSPDQSSSRQHLSHFSRDIAKFITHFIVEEIDENTSMEDLQKMMAVALVYRVLVCFYEVGHVSCRPDTGSHSCVHLVGLNQMQIKSIPRISTV